MDPAHGVLGAVGACGQAHWALGTFEHKHGQGEETSSVGSWQDLGVESLLLSVGDEDVLHLYCDRLLGPVLASDSVYSAEIGLGARASPAAPRRAVERPVIGRPRRCQGGAGGALQRGPVSPRYTF